MRTLLVLVFVLIATDQAGAQRRCVKGIPCGGTCISATKTCHVGTTSTVQERRANPLRSNRAASSPLLSITDSKALAPYVGDALGNRYWSVTCSEATSIPDSLRVFFASEAAARALKYEPLANGGCPP